MTPRWWTAVWAGAVLMVPVPTAAGTLATGDAALAALYPGCQIERTTVYLTEEQKRLVSSLAGSALDAGIVHPYVVRCAGVLSGHVYFDVHRVRTLPEKLLVAVTPDGRLRRVEVLSFDEPSSYLPAAAWYRQLDDRSLGDGLRLGGDIRAIAGATLTATATIAAARRVLALHRVLYPPGPAGAAP